MPKFETLGIGELKAGFEKIRNDMRTRTARTMLVASGRVLKAKAKEIAIANGSQRTGAMTKNTVIKRETGAPVDNEQYHLGVRHGRGLTKKQKSKGERLAVTGRGRVVKRYADDPFYWRFVELGTKRAAPKPFIGPALEQGRKQAIDAMETALVKSLEKVGGK